MELPRIINAGVYRYAQKARETVENTWIALSLSGLIRRTEYDPAGKLVHAFDADKEPFVPYLSVCAPGFVLGSGARTQRSGRSWLHSWRPRSAGARSACVTTASLTSGAEPS